MSVRSSLESIFSHLYAEPAAEEEEAEVAPAPAEAAPEAEAPAEAPVADEALAAPEEAPPDKYAVAISAINDKLEATVLGCKDATAHLEFARSRAAKKDVAVVLAKDFEFGREQRKTGLPPVDSQLQLDVGMIDEHGLLYPHGILEQVQKERAARSCETVGTVDIMAEEAKSRPPPHYMKLTGAFSAQMEAKATLTASVRSVRALRESNRLAAEEEAARQAAAEALAAGADPAAVAAAAAKATKKVHKAPKEIMSMEQMELEDKVMRRVQAPLNFLRNPRFVRGARKPGAEANAEPPYVPRHGALIFCKPDRVNFVDYEVGGVYEIPVQLCNTSRISCRVRVLPPSSRYFSVTLLSYPSGGGMIAPGLNAEMRVRFAPDSLADYDDFVVVQTETDSFPLPLLARRSPPVLTLPAQLHCGYCFVGGEHTVDFGAQNTGGAARFFIVERAAWEAGEREAKQSLQLGYFELTPTFLELQPGDHFRLNVKYAPHEAGQHAVELLMVCDNCQLRDLTLVGNACTASVQIEAVDSLPPVFSHLDGAAPQETLDFAKVALNTRVTKTVRMLNTTPLPLEFEWKHFALPLPLLPPTVLRATPPVPLKSAELGAELVQDSPAFPYSITPASGHLPAGEASDFEISFCPDLAELVPCAAVLVPLGVPAPAMPGRADADAGASDDSSCEVAIRLLGRGEGEDLRLEPAAVLATNGTTLGAERRLALRLRNPNGAQRSWRWEAEAAEPGDAALSVRVEPSEGEVPPVGDVEIALTLRGDAPGLLRRTLLFSCFPHGNELRLPVQLRVEGPSVRLATRRLDFGLVPLGEERTLTLSFDNLSEVEAQWMLAEAPLPRARLAGEAAAAQAAALPPGLAAAAEAARHAEADARGRPPFTWAWAADDLDASAEGAVAQQLAATHAAAGFAMEQACGALAGGGAHELRVTLRPHAEQSMRRVLALRVRDGETQYIAARAEVVARRACLSFSHLNLGTTYVKVPVKKLLKLRNLTQIDTTFEWDLSAAQQANLLMRVEPRSGVLGAAEELALGLEVVAQQAGDFDLLIKCRLHAGTAPTLGLRLSSKVQGLTVSYEVLPPDAELLKVLAPSAAPHVPPPEAFEEPPGLDFGADAAIFEQRSLVLVLRNHSAVPTRYSLKALRFPAGALPDELKAPPSAASFSLSASMMNSLRAADLAARRAEEEERREREGASMVSTRSLGSAGGRSGGGGGGGGGGGSTAGLSHQPSRSGRAGGLAATGGSSAAHAARPLLGNAHEHSQPFFSEGGVNYSAQQTLQRREAALLADARGVCFELLPASGQLRPWGQLVVSVALHSNMWGHYDDILEAQLDGLPPARLPMTVGVVGSPIKLHDATVGLSLRTAPPLLSWAPVPVGAAPQQKTIRVLNHGCAEAQLEWALVEKADAARPLAATVGVGAGGRVSLALGRPAPTPIAAEQASWTVTPAAKTIAAGKERVFHVSFAQDAPGAYEAALVATLRHPKQVALPLPAHVTDESRRTATDLHPELRLNLRADTLAPRLEMSERLKLKFKVSPVDPPSHPSYTRCLTMRNPSCTTLQFVLHVPPPFSLVEARCSTSQFELLGQTAVDDTSLFTLPPSESVQLVVAYVPEKRRRRQAALAVGADGRSQAGSLAGGGNDDATSVASGATSRTAATSVADGAAGEADHYLSHRSKVEAELAVSFTNGSVQTFPLVAAVTQPYVELDLGTLDFGSVHLSCAHEVELGMVNPTEAEARWSIKHTPVKLTAREIARQRQLEHSTNHVEPDDVPEVFAFASMTGTIAPRAGQIPARVPLAVKFVPTAPGHFKSTFTFKVAHGFPAKLTVLGVATLREEDLDVIPPEAHLRLMHPGTLGH